MKSCLRKKSRKWGKRVRLVTADKKRLRPPSLLSFLSQSRKALDNVVLLAKVWNRLFLIRKWAVHWEFRSFICDQRPQWSPKRYLKTHGTDIPNVAHTYITLTTIEQEARQNEHEITLHSPYIFLRCKTTRKLNSGGHESLHLSKSHLSFFSVVNCLTNSFYHSNFKN